MKNRLRLSVIVLIVGLLLPTVFVAACGGRKSETNNANSNVSPTSGALPSPTYDAARADAEQKRLDDYIAQFKAQPLPKRISAGKGYIKAKALILKKEEDERIDGEVYKGEVVRERCYSIREDRCTEVPGDNSTVIYITVSSQRIGRYSNGAAAYIKIWKISIIDTTIPAIVATRTIEGGVPEELGSGAFVDNEPFYGDEPSLEFQEYINALPLR